MDFCFKNNAKIPIYGLLTAAVYPDRPAYESPADGISLFFHGLTETEMAAFMLDRVLAFIDRHRSFILTTHDPADADGLGAELVFAAILKQRGKECHIINAQAVPDLFRFMDPNGLVEQWEETVHEDLLEKSALLVLDTSDEYNIGTMKNAISLAREVFVIDHHEPSPFVSLAGFIDPGAAATSEILVEIAAATQTRLDAETAKAAYTGIVYDTGFFAYSKTSLRTFDAARRLLACGAVPYEVYQHLNESDCIAALLLQKRVFSSLELYLGGRAAVQLMRKEDLAATGARFEDAEGFINIPMRVREIAVSVFIKETPEGNIRCSLRSKGTVNVSKIAQDFGGGGHVSAAGFRSGMGIEETLKKVIASIGAQMQMDRL